MARSRRSRGRGMRSVKRKLDWIYLENSYGSGDTTLAAGIAASIAFPLTVSQNTRRYVFGGTPNILPAFTAYRSWASIPEGSKMRVYAVDGEIRLTPSTWNVGDSFTMGWRLMHGPQEASTGDLLVDLAYSMFTRLAAADEHPSMWANAGFLKEKRFSIANVSGTAVTASGVWHLPIRWRSSRGVTIGNDRCLAVYLESTLGSIQLRASPWLRALVSVND